MYSYSVTHFYILLWLALIFMSCAIVGLFDWYFYQLPWKDVKLGKNLLHVPVLLVLTAIIGFVTGLGIPQLLGIIIYPTFPIMISWGITFAILHGAWIFWRSRLSKTKEQHG